MRLSLTATPEELQDHGHELVEQLATRLERVAPEVAEELRKARPTREPGLKYRVLRDLHAKTAAAYRKQLDAMLVDVGEVLDRTTKASTVHKSLSPIEIRDLVDLLVEAKVDDLKKAEEDEDDEDKTEPGDVDVETGKLVPTLEEKEEEKKEKEEEEEGEEEEKSLDEEPDLVKSDQEISEELYDRVIRGFNGMGPRESLEKAGPFIGPRGGKWADAKHTIPWKEKKTVRTGLIQVSDAKVREVADKILENVLANKQGVVRVTEPGWTTTQLEMPTGEKIKATVFYMPRGDITDPRGIQGSARTTVRPGIGGEPPYVDSTTIRIEASPDAGMRDLGTLKELVRNVLSHEMAHAVDPSIVKGALAAAQRAMNKDETEKESQKFGSVGAKTEEEYYNLPTEITARMQQIARDILDEKAVAEIRSAWESYQANPKEMPPPYRPEDVATWSPTWELIKDKLTVKNRQRILKMAARVVEGIHEGTLEAVKKSLSEDLSCDFDRLEKAGPFIGPRGGKWADTRHTIPWAEEYRPAKLPETPHHTTPERQHQVEVGLQRLHNAIRSWEGQRREHPTRFATLSSKALLERTTRFAGQIKAAKSDGRKEDERKWRVRYDEAKGEIASRKRYYDLAREKVALEEAKTTGILTLGSGEIAHLIGTAGDVYQEAGHKGGYAPELFKTSDLSGMKVRHYVRLPDGRIAHPDEIHEAQTRGRIIVVDRVKVPTRDWTEAPEGVAKSLEVDEDLEKAGPFIGPRGGRWKDIAHTIPWKDPEVPAAPQLPKLQVGPLEEDQVFGQTEILARYPRANLEEFIAKIESYQTRLGAKPPASLERWHRAVLGALQEAQRGLPEVPTAPAEPEATGGLTVAEPKKPRKVRRGKAIRKPTEPAEKPQLELGLPERKVAEKKKGKRKPVRRRKERKVKVEAEAPVPPEITQVGEHIWGSRKDLAELGAITSSAQLEGMGFDDARRVVTKSALVPPHDLQTLRGLGMTPGGAHMALALLATIRAKPGDSTAERAAYIDRVHEVLGGLKNCRSARDVSNLTQEYLQAQMRAPKWAEVAQVPQDAAALKARIAELEKQNPKAKYRYRSDYSRGQYVIVTKAAKPYDVLGTKFAAFIKSRSKSYDQAYVEATTADGAWQISKGGQPKTAEEGWKYLEERGREKNEARRKKGKEAAKKRKPGVSVTQQVAGVVEREGHTVDVPDANPERARTTFGLREIDFGQKGWMSQPDREYHVKALEGALHDFSEMLGVDPELLSLGGRIGIAMGARGQGKAAAHYEGSTKAINITRFRGNGTLAHEWGHALDNIMAEHFNEGSDKPMERFLSESPDNEKWPPEIKAAIQAVHAAVTKHPDPKAAKIEHKRQVNAALEVRNDLVDKNNKLVKEAKAFGRKVAPEHVEVNIERRQKRVVEYDAEIAKIDAVEEKRGKLGWEKTARREQLRAWKKVAEAEIAGLQTGEGVTTVADLERIKQIKVEIEDLRLPINRATAEHRSLRKLDPTSSNYLRSSRSLGEYWQRPREMFARAFEGFAQDALEDHGRRNSYLVDGTRRPYQIQKTENGPIIEPWPQGEERKQINAAIEGLLKVLSTTGALRKALVSLSDEPALVLRKAKPKGDLEEPLSFDPTKKEYDADEKRYEVVKSALEDYGYVSSDYEPGGRLEGRSTNELVDLLNELRKQANA